MSKKTKPFIAVDSLTRSYGKGDNAFNALNGVSFTIAEGANVAIVGKSGSGKSTLMHALAGLDRPSSGSVSYHENNIWELSKKDLNKFRNSNIGFIFQTFYMQPSESVLKNVNLPLEIAGVGQKERKDRSMAALKQLEIEDKAQNKAVDLSGGQKQRVCIARAIAGDPEIIFADEPTGNLDSVTGDKVEKILFDLNKQGVTLIVVTHDLDLAKKFDARIYVKDGEIEKIEGRGVKS